LTRDADTPTIASLTLGCGAGREAADMAASAFVGSGPPHRPRTNIYVDGFNFYYAAFHSARAALPPCLKWLDVRRLCQNALPRNEICRIRYFTAKVTSTASDPGRPARQEAYLQALRHVPGLTIHYGQFVVRQKYLKAVNPTPGQAKRPLVFVPEEKGSDVNLASYLILDACRGAYDVAVLVSNDSDLKEPVRLAREEIGKAVGVLRVDAEPRGCVFRDMVDFIRPLRRSHFENSQLPDVVSLSESAEVRRPVEWT
jgi:uncharacterized LabA/DUF88 family protein